MTKKPNLQQNTEASRAGGFGLPAASAAGAGVSVQFAPTVTHSSPIDNMGENSVTVDEQTVLRGRRVLTTLAKSLAHKNLAIVDWLNITVHEDTWNKTAGDYLIDSDHYVIEASKHLERIFGFGVTEKRDSGSDYYLESWIVGEKFGKIGFGGQRETMLITISGLGLQNATSGWEKRLYEFLKNTAVRPCITRIDLAHDDIQGAYISVDWAAERWAERGFNSGKGGRLVDIQRQGNWDLPNGSGRTLTLGTRKAGKYLRFYEKGKQLGDPNSNWCRAEVEFKSCDRIIPLEILLEPSAYFAGAYPCFAYFCDQETSKRLELKTKTAHITVDAAVRIFKHQFGKYQSFFRQLFNDEEWLKMSCSDDLDAVPKRLGDVIAGMGKAIPFIHENFAVPTVSNNFNGLGDFRTFKKRHHIKADNYWGI